VEADTEVVCRGWLSAEHLAQGSEEVPATVGGFNVPASAYSSIVTVRVSRTTPTNVNRPAIPLAAPNRTTTSGISLTNRTNTSNAETAFPPGNTCTGRRLVAVGVMAK
jgi:hypothetical protein